MDIKYHGGTAFSLSTREAFLLANPLSDGCKINIDKVTPDIVLQTNEGQVSADNTYVINLPGEYELREIFVNGLLTDKSSIVPDVYAIRADDISLVYLDKTVKEINKKLLEELGVVNVLVVSLNVNGGEIEKTFSLIKSIDPQMVLLVDYTKDQLDELLKLVGGKGVETIKKLKLKSTDFSDEDVPVQIILLEKTN